MAKANKTMNSLEDFCYAHFRSLAQTLRKGNSGIGRSMEAASIAIHPEVYLSMIIFFMIISSIGAIVYIPLSLLEILPMNFYLSVILMLAPLIVLIIGLMLPAALASNKINGLKNEIPFASMYLSVMMSGGLSPYASLLRLKKTTLMPQLKKEIERIQRIALTSGQDQVSAMEEAARSIGLREYKELLLGYASALRTGGDVLHYLYTQTDAMFKNLTIRVRAMGANMGILLEIFTIVAILGVQGLYMLFIVSLSFPDLSAFAPEFFFLFGYIILPGISLAFLYFADTMQISYPVSQWKTYIPLAASIPLGIFLGIQMVLPFYGVMLFNIPILTEIPTAIMNLLNLNPGSEPALGLAISLIALALPPCTLDMYYSGKERGVLTGVTSFLRDIVENRKSGLSPEKSIMTLSGRDYGGFSKHLKNMGAKLAWGVPMKTIFQDIFNDIKNWPSLVNLYLLIDAIEVGGGTDESLEQLAEFAETSRELETEKMSVLQPLFIVPYIGAGLLTVTTVMILQLFVNVGSFGQVLISSTTLSRTLVTPLILHSLTMGLVAGKIVSGRTSAGFLHAIVLILISILGMLLAK